MDLLVSEARVEVSQKLIDNELVRIEQKFRADLSQMGISFEDYLKHQKKSKEDWRISENENAKRQVVIQLALHQIAKQENFKVSDEIIIHTVDHLIKQYPNLDKNKVYAYTEEQMLNTFVIEYLFTGKVPNEKELFKHHKTYKEP